MFGVQSIRRNLEAEDKAFAKFCDKKTTDATDGAGEMQITSAGNVTINYPEPSGGQSESVAPKPKADAGWLPKLLLAASLLGGGTGLGYMIHELAKPTPHTQDTDTDTITEMDFP